MSVNSPVRPGNRFRRLAAVALGGAVVLTTAGCGTDDADSGATDSASASASEEPTAETEEEPTVVEIEFADGAVTPQGERIEVDAGDPIDLEVTADEPGELHLHTESDQALAYGEGTETFEIQIDRPGVVVVESHELDQVVVQFEAR